VKRLLAVLGPVLTAALVIAAVALAGKGPERIALPCDKREDRLFVSGGPTGKAFVYDASSGAELAAFQLTAAGLQTFINESS
jgi:hypothetical protein